MLLSHIYIDSSGKGQSDKLESSRWCQLPGNQLVGLQLPELGSHLLCWDVAEEALQTQEIIEFS